MKLALVFLVSFMSQFAKAGLANVSSVQQNADGSFHVICTTMTQEQVTAAALKAEAVCNPAPKYALKPGLYKVIAGDNSYYDQRVVPNMDGAGNLVSLTVTWTGSAITLDYPCSNDVCLTNYSGIERRITIKDNMNYEYVGSGTAASFQWSADFMKLPKSRRMGGSDR